MNKDIYGDKISYVTDELSIVPTNESNLNEENRIKYVTDLAAVSRGKSESANPPKRYKALLKEASPTDEQIKAFNGDGKMKNGSPSRPFEFLPIVVDLLISEYSLWDTNYDYSKDPIHVFNNFAELSNGILQHSYIELVDGDSDLVRVYTNMRCLINAGVKYENVPYNTQEELKHFRALKANIPMFVWGQVPNTHCALSKEAQSDRVTANDNYWLPSDFRNRVFKHVEDITTQLNNNGLNGQDKLLAVASKAEYSLLLQPSSRDGVVHLLLNKWSQTTVQGMFKELGYPREIYSRAIYYFKYKEVVFTGWNNNPKVWEHLFVERNAKPDVWDNWTQNETKQLVTAIKEVI